MKTHRAWMLALTSVIAVAVGQAAWGQAPSPTADPSFATFSQGTPIIQQVSHDSCGACNGSGCAICGQGSASSWTPIATSSCGCGSGACGGSCDDGPSMMASAPTCGACGTSCGGACGGLGMGGDVPGSMALSPDGHVFHGNGHGGFQIGGNGPFGGGGCCTPIWYDLDVSWSTLRRKDTDGMLLSTRGVDGDPVLSTSDVDGEDAHGFRLTYAMLIGSATSLEAGYFGSHEWDESASVTGASDLYSVFSNFGLDQSLDNSIPPNVILGFPQTVDAAIYHGVAFSSDMQSFELNIRRRWIKGGCLLHGSYLAGIRYVSLDEHLSYDTEVADGGFLNYDIEAENEAFGFQLGGDLFLSISPRFKIGVEFEGGVFGNEATATSVTNLGELTDVGGGNFEVVNAPTLNEEDSETDVAFIGELSATAMFRVTPRLTIKGGYTAFYLDNMALAVDNFNTQYPGNTPRTSVFNNEGDVVYHGANLGLTWMW